MHHPLSTDMQQRMFDNKGSLRCTWPKQSSRKKPGHLLSQRPLRALVPAQVPDDPFRRVERIEDGRNLPADAACAAASHRALKRIVCTARKYFIKLCTLESIPRCIPNCDYPESRLRAPLPLEGSLQRMAQTKFRSTKIYRRGNSFPTYGFIHSAACQPGFPMRGDRH